MRIEPMTRRLRIDGSVGVYNRQALLRLAGGLRPTSLRLEKFNPKNADQVLTKIKATDCPFAVNPSF
jgi:hypothetical protein